MALTTWMTIFLALVALSILIQAGILLWIYFGVRRMETLFSRWEPKIIAKIVPVSKVIEQKTHAYSETAGRMLDHLTSYTRRLGSLLSTQLDHADRLVQTTDQRYLHPILESVPAKKKLRNRQMTSPEKS